jgi:hypothetical protein
VRLFGACDDEQSGGVAVEAVHDARPLRVAAGGAEREQTVRERRALVGPAGWTTRPAGLSTTSRCSSSWTT